MENPDALGSAWFVKKLSKVSNADQAMQGMTTLDPKAEAITYDSSLSNKTYQVDSTATIQLRSYEPDRLVYSTDNPQEGLAVFSEIYYPHGWKAVLDGSQELTIHQVDYTFRGVEIPAGKHTIEFAFAPTIVKTGRWISLSASLAFVVIAVGSVFVHRKKEKA